MPSWTIDDLVDESNAQFQREAEAREPWCAEPRAASTNATDDGAVG